MDDIIINLQINKEEVQSHTEANYGRELTELELFRLKGYWSECGDASWERMKFMDACIRDAMDTKDSNWELVDREYYEKKLPTN